MQRALAIACATAVALTATLAAATHSLHSVSHKYQLFFHLQRVHSEAKIEAEFVARSTPGDALFRQWLAPAALTELVQSSGVVIAKVRAYLETEMSCAEVALTHTKDVMVCTLDPRVANTAVYSAVRGAFDKASASQADIPRVAVTDVLPSAVTKFVRDVTAYRAMPAAAVAAMRAARRAARTKLGQPGMSQTPHTINRRYMVPSALPAAFDRSVSVGVGEFEGEYYTPSDMVGFAQRYGLRAYDLRNLGPQPTPDNADATEGTLDLQYIGSVLNASLPIWWLQQSAAGGGSDPGQINFHKWVDKVLAMPSVPAVVSVSWGMGDYRYAWQPTVLVEDNDAFRKMGLAGVTLLAASGDSGPGTRNGILQCDTFSPSWPASSPYLTSVGATYANTESGKETSVNWSGGGFSDTFAAPSWQRQAVATYIRRATAAGTMPNASFYNRTGRAYPDVSALGTNYMIEVSGQWSPVSGTSCASPTFAGVLGLIAAERSAAGKPALGFLNPTLYKLGRVGYDVVNGQSQDDNCIPFFPIAGFPAVVGFDAVSGLGTPQYPFLRKHLMD